ncbi:MAG: hypothetical protein AAFV29_18340, partial [Myxococcota bacterium]
IDLFVRANYRFMISNDDGYGRRHAYIRHSVAFDCVKHLFDYNGFVPFLGAGLSVEVLSLDVEDREAADFSVREVKPAGSVVFGWDIRPAPTASWMLRTNLRFTPGLRLRSRENDVAFDHVEFNFIQLIIFPERMFG